MACDLRDAARTAAAVRAAAPDLVIHAQAMSNVDQCELEPDAAWEQNVRALEHLVAALDPGRTWLVALGTDYVFDGRKGAPYDETDTPNPLGAYGRAKLAAERVALGFPRGIVARTSTLFGPGRMNFCDAIVGAVREGRGIEAFLDQTTSPTYTEDLAAMLRELIGALTVPRTGPIPRVVHVTNAGGCSRVEFARRVVELLGRSPDLVRPIRMAQQQRPAKRPAYSALTTIELPKLTGRIMPPWDDALHTYLRQRHAFDSPMQGGPQR